MASARLPWVDRSSCRSCSRRCSWRRLLLLLLLLHLPAPSRPALPFACSPDNQLQALHITCSWPLAARMHCALCGRAARLVLYSWEVAPINTVGLMERLRQPCDSCQASCQACRSAGRCRAAYSPEQVLLTQSHAGAV